MNKELLADIHELAMDDPGVNLVVKNSVAAIQDLRKHIFVHWVSSGALLVDGIQQLASFEVLLFYLFHQADQSRKHLYVDG